MPVPQFFPQEEYEHIDPLGHPMRVGDYVLFTEVKRSSVFFGQIISFSKSRVNIQYHNKSQCQKDTKGVYVITQQYEYNKEKFAEFFI